MGSSILVVKSIKFVIKVINLFIYLSSCLFRREEKPLLKLNLNKKRRIHLDLVLMRPMNLFH
jgi:hypothetical protein